MKISKNKIMVGVIAALCVVVVALVVALVVRKGNDENTNDSQFTPNIDANASDIQDSTKSSRDQQGIRIPGYPSITIDAGQENVKMNLYNPEANPCYFTFEIVLSDTGETIYKSDMVAPGKAITNVKLQHSLEAGEYNATIKITTAALTDGTEMNGANVETVLIVK